MRERVPMIAGNWKMNLSLDAARVLLRGIADPIGDLKGMEVLVAPPYTLLTAVKQAIGTSEILLGAQNMHWEEEGAFTGEISPKMLLETGCTHVILGHSERRSLFSETNEMINLKVKAAVKAGLTPILCIGETLEEREKGRTFEVIQWQLEGSLSYFREKGSIPPALIFAYEPVWAIGTGRTATPEQAQEVQGFIRRWLKEDFGAETAEAIRILYGGSVKPDNIKDIMAKPDIDGALVGGASLKAESFLSILRFQ